MFFYSQGHQHSNVFSGKIYSLPCIWQHSGVLRTYLIFHVQVRAWTYLLQRQILKQPDTRVASGDRTPYYQSCCDVMHFERATAGPLAEWTICIKYRLLSAWILLLVQRRESCSILIKWNLKIEISPSVRIPLSSHPDVRNRRKSIIRKLMHQSFTKAIARDMDTLALHRSYDSEQARVSLLNFIECNVSTPRLCSPKNTQVEFQELRHQNTSVLLEEV